MHLAGKRSSDQEGVPRVLFLGVTYAGHKTRFLNLVSHTEDDRRIRPTFRQVTGWVDDGLIERMPIVSPAIKGRARAVLEALPIAAIPRPDVIWTSAGEVVTPHLWSQLGWLRRPMVLDLDWTLEQQERLAPIYFGRPPKTGVRAIVARKMERALWNGVTMFTPWSRWAAESLRQQGVEDERIRILPPGVDLNQWRPRPEGCIPGKGRLRILFVGGDFKRKGGDMLLKVFEERFADRCELDIVTRDAVLARRGVRVHRAEPNSQVLYELYARADLFVMPSRAECFGIATIEAMASGLPVLVGNVGGAQDIVDDGETGWLVEPSPTALAAGLERALARPDLLQIMGQRAREVAEQRFDGKRNDRLIVDLVIELAARNRRSGDSAPSWNYR